MQKNFGIALIVSFVLVELICGIFLVMSLVFPLKYRDDIKKFSLKYNLVESEVASLIRAESGFSKDKVSKKGAIGLMQIMPSTALYISNLYDIDYTGLDDLFIPAKNIEIGSAYLNYLTKKFEERDTVIASYNAGETIVRTWLKNSNYSSNGKSLDTIPFNETKNYVKKVKNGTKIYAKFHRL